MLRIHTITSAPAAKSYYTQASDYYSEGSELVGQWGGKLAQMLGLSGTVDRESFERLVDGLHPQTAKELKPRRKDDRRVGIDCVWSGPKSYSVLEAMTGDEDLLRAFREAKPRNPGGDAGGRGHPRPPWRGGRGPQDRQHALGRLRAQHVQGGQGPGP